MAVPTAPGRRPRVLRQITRRELDAVTEDPVCRRPERRAKIRRQPGVGNHIELPVHVVGNDCPAGRGDPVVRLTDKPFGDLFRVERFVGFAHGLDDGVAVLETGPERTEAGP